MTFIVLRDWSLITERGGLQNGKIVGPKLFARPPQNRVKHFAPPLLKSGNFMAKTSSFLCPPFRMAKTFSVPPFRRGKTSRAPPSRFVAPPLPVISDQSLTRTVFDHVQCELVLFPMLSTILY